MECLYKGVQVLFNTCSAAVSPQACRAFLKNQRHFGPCCVCYTQLPTGCATAALTGCAAVVCSVLFWGSDFSEVSWGPVPCVQGGQKHCPDHQFVQFTTTTTKPKTNIMFITSQLISQNAGLPLPEMCCPVHVWFTTHLARNLSSDLCVYRGVCRNGEAGRDVCSVLQAEPLCNCDSVYKGTDKIKFSH